VNTPHGRQLQGNTKGDMKFTHKVASTDALVVMLFYD